MTKQIKETAVQLLKTLTILIGKSASRKFVVWIVATHMAYLQILDSANWLTISMIYMGAQAVLDWKDHAISTTNSENSTKTIVSDEDQFPIRPVQ